MSQKNSSPVIFEFLFYAFLLLLFFSLGSDQDLHLRVQYGAGFGLLGLCLISPGVISWKMVSGKWTLAALSIFLAYEYIRAAFMKLGGGSEQSLYGPQTGYYLQALWRWTYSFGCFFLAYQLFCRRSQAGRLHNFLSLAGFFLAIVAIPPLMRHPGVPPVYHWGSGNFAQSGFFPPIFYAHPWAGKYLVEQFAHVNYVGDVMAIGFFSALGLLVYHFELFRDAWHTEKSRGSSRIPLKVLQPFFLFLTVCLVITTSILLLFSRGTILCFSLLFFGFLLGILLWFRSRAYLQLVLAVVLITGGFNLWSGNLKGVWKELQTLSGENADAQHRTSFSTNKEGARRALGMHRDYPLWGVGTGAYKDFAQHYAVEKAPDGQFDFASYESMNHYLQLLAEEGIGAYLYFLFLAVYLLEAAIRLFKVKSRFQYILSLSLLSAVVMIFSHGAFNHLLERVSMSVLTYIIMGASLGLLRDDFDKVLFSKTK